MDIWKHSELSASKFGGLPQDYIEIHKFLDSSKLFYFNVKHRALLHHTFGISLCIQLFGDVLKNSQQKKILVRDIAGEHLKEDLNGQVPTLYDWFYDNPPLAPPSLDRILHIEDQPLRAFVLKPYLDSGIEDTLLLTFSDFGVALTERLLGTEKALALRTILPAERRVKSFLKEFKFSKPWQYSPDMDQLKWIKKLL